MAEVLQLSDGSVHTVFDIRDMMELIDDRLGYEARRWLEEYLTEDDLGDYVSDLEKEVEGVRSHHREPGKGNRPEAAVYGSRPDRNHHVERDECMKQIMRRWPMPSSCRR